MLSCFELLKTKQIHHIRQKTKDNKSYAVTQDAFRT